MVDNKDNYGQPRQYGRLLCNQLASSGAVTALPLLVGDLGDFPHPEFN